MSDVSLLDITISSLVYLAVSEADVPYRDFRRKVGGSLNLSRRDHCRHMIDWLNQWGCRQFMRERHSRARVVTRLTKWWSDNKGRLPARNKDLLALLVASFSGIQFAFDELKDIRACWKSSDVSAQVGPVGAAKILFALRPRALPPWDNPIRKWLSESYGVRSYREYLLHLQDVLDDLAEECRSNGFDIGQLPTRIARPQATLPKLVDEYYWLTITKGFQPPSRRAIRNWLKWSRH